MLNIVIALRMWGSFWCHSNITVYCDNLGVVFVVKTGKTKNAFLALCVRNIWLYSTYTADYDIDLDTAHIPGCHNTTSDALSRIYSNSTVNSNILNHLREKCTWKHISSSYFTWTFIYNFRFESSFLSSDHGCSPEDQDCIQTFYKESSPYTHKDSSVHLSFLIFLWPCQFTLYWLFWSIYIQIICPIKSFKTISSFLNLQLTASSPFDKGLC